MSKDEVDKGQTPVKSPWHMWVVGIMTLLWNGSGALTFLMAHLGMLSNLSSEEAAYYAAQPLWYVILVNIATWGAFFAGIALLLKSRLAFTLFGFSFAVILLTDLIELVGGNSRALVSEGGMNLALMVLVIAFMQLLYTWRWKKMGVLK